MPDQPPSRRRFHFRLRALMIVTLLCFLAGCESRSAEDILGKWFSRSTVTSDVISIRFDDDSRAVLDKQSEYGVHEGTYYFVRSDSSVYVSTVLRGKPMRLQGYLTDDETLILKSHESDSKTWAESQLEMRLSRTLLPKATRSFCRTEFK
jgi:hypothetical protein